MGFGALFRSKVVEWSRLPYRFQVVGIESEFSGRTAQMGTRLVTMRRATLYNGSDKRYLLRKGCHA